MKLPRWFRKFVSERIPTERCMQCRKWITDQEWVANWCSCDACFNKHLELFPIAGELSGDSIGDEGL